MAEAAASGVMLALIGALAIAMWRLWGSQVRSTEILTQTHRDDVQRIYAALELYRQQQVELQQHSVTGIQALNVTVAVIDERTRRIEKTLNNKGGDDR